MVAQKVRPDVGAVPCAHDADDAADMIIRDVRILVQVGADHRRAHAHGD